MLSRREFSIAGIASLAAMPAAANTYNISTILEHVRQLRGNQAVELRFLIPDGCQSNLRPIIKRFTAETGVAIRKIVAPPDDVNSRLILSIAVGETLDLALPATFGLPDLVDAQALHPLDELYAKFDALKTQSSCLYKLGDAVNGHNYGLQTDGDIYLMFYNKALLEHPQISAEYRERFGHEPRPATTWTELDRLMRFYHRPKLGIYGGCLFRTTRYVGWEWWLRCHGYGLLPFDRLMRPQTTDHLAIQALADLLRSTDSQVPEARTLSLVDNWQRYAKGDALCNIGWGGSQKYFRRNSQGFPDGLLFEETPGLEINGTAAASISYFNWGWNYTVPATAKNHEIAFLFALFANSPVMSTKAVSKTGGFFDPFRDEHYDDKNIQEAYGQDFLDVHKRGMRMALPDFYLRGRDKYFRILNSIILQALNYDISPEHAMQRVHDQWEAVTDDLGREQQIEQWARLLAHYPRSLQKLLS